MTTSTHHELRLRMLTHRQLPCSIMPCTSRLRRDQAMYLCNAQGKAAPIQNSSENGIHIVLDYYRDAAMQDCILSPWREAITCGTAVLIRTCS